MSNLATYRSASSSTSVKFAKLFFCILLDLFDFTIGRLPAFGMGTDFISIIIARAMWSRFGFLGGLSSLTELIDITEQIDAQLPSCTLIALNSWNKI